MPYLGKQPTASDSLSIFKYVATSSQTNFSGADADGATLAYDIGNGSCQVWLNGIRLDRADVTATDGTSVVLAACTAGDIVHIQATQAFTPADVVPKAAGGTFDGAVVAGAGATVPSGQTLTIASGATIANSGTATGFGFGSGDVILADDGSAGAPGLAFADDTDHGFFRTSDKLGYSVGGSERIRFDGKLIFVGDTANSDMSIGMTLNNDTSDDEIFALKSSDVAHSLTQYIETDSFFSIRKWGGAGGGTYISSIAENGEANGLVFNVIAGDPAASAGTTTTGTILFYAGCCEDTPGTLEDFASNAVLFSLRKRNASGATSVFHIDEDGDIFYHGSASAFDNEDDALLARAFEIEQSENAAPSRKRSEPAQIIKSEFDKFVGNAKEKLTDAGIISRCDPDDPSSYDEDGNLGRPMVNLTQLQRLHNGAIWQQRVMFETMKQVADEMLPGFSEKLNERLEAQSLPALPV